jgi:ABC-type transporter Mla subunit MlaD
MGIPTTIRDLKIAFDGVTQIIGSVTGKINELLDKAGAQERAERKVAQAVQQTGEAVGFSAQQLYDMAAQLQEVTNFGDEDTLNQVIAQLLTFTNVQGEQFKGAVVAAQNLATMLDGDLQSAAIQLGKALNDPTEGLTALTRSGV